MYEYRARIIKIVDGDAVDVDINLGFDIILSNERVRINGIDTPESRTRDNVEKKFGLAAKARLKSLLGKTCTLKTQIDKSGEDMKGKFGRILGDFDVYDATTDSWKSVVLYWSTKATQFYITVKQKQTCNRRIWPTEPDFLKKAL